MKRRWPAACSSRLAAASPAAAPAQTAQGRCSIPAVLRACSAEQQFAARRRRSRRVFGDVVGAVLGRRRSTSSRRTIVLRRRRVRRASADRASARSCSTGRRLPLGIPLTATITPIEVTGGYRFTDGAARHARTPAPAWACYALQGDVRLSPRRRETSTSRHAGVISRAAPKSACIAGSASRRRPVHARARASSASAGSRRSSGENDLGGTAVRVRVIVGR